MSTTDPTASTTEVEPRFEIKSRSGLVLYVARASNVRDAVAEAVAAKSGFRSTSRAGHAIRRGWVGHHGGGGGGVMRYFRRGAHWQNGFRPTVADLVWDCSRIPISRLYPMRAAEWDRR